MVHETDDPVFPPALGLRKREEQLLELLLRRELVTLDAFYVVAYPRDPPLSNMLAQTANHLRGRLQPHGIVVNLLHGRGYWMDNQNKAKLRKLCEDLRRETD